uniref:BRCT domain-containing protein n=1 Tax=Ascaris lumbricoides TaxID=6252 RepID=A0A0M3HNN7_ASCLU
MKLAVGSAGCALPPKRSVFCVTATKSFDKLGGKVTDFAYDLRALKRWICCAVTPSSTVVVEELRGFRTTLLKLCTSDWLILHGGEITTYYSLIPLLS